MKGLKARRITLLSTASEVKDLNNLFSERCVEGLGLD